MKIEVGITKDGYWLNTFSNVD